MSLTFNGLNGLSFGDGSSQNTAASGFGFKNRIINGDMRIDQRNNGSLVSATSTYSTDRFKQEYAGTGGITSQQSTDAPVGFTNSLKITVSSTEASLASGSYYQIFQGIEGNYISDFRLGTSFSSSIAVSIWVKASQTGTYSVQLANDSGTRCYPTTITINAANTWEKKIISIPPTLSGTFNSNTSLGLGIRIGFGYGASFSGATPNTWMTAAGFASSFAPTSNNMMATSGATFYMTGLQLEKGATATDFDYRPFSAELSLGQRYYYNTMWLRDANSLIAPTNNQVELQGARHQFGDVTGYRGQAYNHPVLMRAAPTIVVYNPLNGGATGQWYFYSNTGSGQNYSGGPAAYRDGIVFNAYTGVSVGTSGLSCQVWAHWSASAEF